MRTANETPSLSARSTRLLHPAFLIGLGLLIANDWLFKPMFHNALTGKLSDVAGIFAFAYFWCATGALSPVAVVGSQWGSRRNPYPLRQGRRDRSHCRHRRAYGA